MSETSKQLIQKREIIRNIVIKDLQITADLRINRVMKNYLFKSE